MRLFSDKFFGNSNFFCNFSNLVGIKAIGKLYIDLFEQEVEKLDGVKFLVQGTIYSDVIESKGSKHAANIKSHHNVGGLPDTLKLSLLEPIKDFYTDQVRE